MAIQLLKKCEDENRNATPEEQEILSRYVGWGGLADAFDETKAAWETEYLELKTVLTPEEYAAARASTLNAHYTQPIVIESMYQVLENLGFTKRKYPGAVYGSWELLWNDSGESKPVQTLWCGIG